MAMCLCLVVLILLVLISNAMFIFHSTVSFSDNGFLFRIRCCCDILPIHDLCPSFHLFSCNHNTYVTWWGIAERKWDTLWNAANGPGVLMKLCCHSVPYLFSSITFLHAQVFHISWAFVSFILSWAIRWFYVLHKSFLLIKRMQSCEHILIFKHTHDFSTIVWSRI
jgi:hypothetical protein